MERLLEQFARNMEASIGGSKRLAGRSMDR